MHQNPSYRAIREPCCCVPYQVASVSKVVSVEDGETPSSPAPSVEVWLRVASSWRQADASDAVASGPGPPLFLLESSLRI
jgi:hypothetical protein